MFRTKYQRVQVNAETGSPIRVVREAVYDKRKNITVVEKGKENLYAYINSFADSVDINVLLARYRNGEKDALLQRAGAYIDISSMPTNINEFIDLSRSAQNLFDTLPIETKEKFNNNVMEFISTVGDPEWIEKMNESPSEIAKNIVVGSKQTADLNKELAKPELNRVVPLENPGIDVPDVTITDPVINPLTGNEVK